MPYQVVVPSQSVPLFAHAFGNEGEAAVAVSAANPLPTAPPGTRAADVAPLAGADNSAGVEQFGPFVPRLGREVVLTLSGTWSGSVALMRSVDGGATVLPATLGGTAISFTANVNEIVWVETEAAATLYLSITLNAGAVTYRVAQ